MWKDEIKKRYIGYSRDKAEMEHNAQALEEDLAGLVCNMVNTPQCINPKKGAEGGDTWEKRRKFMETMDKKIKDGGQPGWDAGLSFGDSQ